jgi:ligand-binding sensor domain-containing protein/serine phosphatase RsbU (regulator of sigma subunit)
VLNVYVDSQNTLWIKTIHSLDQFDVKTGKFRQFSHSQDNLRVSSENIAYPIFEDRQKHLWVGTQDGLNLFDRELQLFYRYISIENNIKSLSDQEVRCIHEGQKGNLWIGTRHGLNAFNPATQEFKRYYPVSGNGSLEPCNCINALYRDRAGKLWVGTMGGLFFFDIYTGKFDRVVSNKKEAFNYPVYSIVHDKSGSIWIGTLKGLIKINSQQSKFKLYRSGENPLYSFASNDISSLQMMDNNSLMIGTWNKGLDIFNRRANTVKHFDFSRQEMFGNNYIHNIVELKPNEYWMGTNNGIIIFNPASGDYFNLCDSVDIIGCESLTGKRVNAITKNKNGTVWVGTINGLYEIQPSTKHIIPYFNNPQKVNSLCNNTIYSLADDHKGNLWIGTENGLDRLETGTGRFNHYGDGRNSKPILSSISIYSLYISADGILWIGTASGLNKFNTNDKSLKILTEKEGLSDNIVHAILPDNKQNIWVSTNHGLSEIDSRTNHIRTFDIYDGLQDYEFNQYAACRNQKGELFFGGVAGINSFFPDSLNRNTYIPPVVITSVQLIAEDGKIQQVNPFADKIIIPHQTRSFNINFAALDYTVPEKNSFAYKFYTSNEDQWIDIGNKHWLTFSNLKPGEYTFKVKGSNSDLAWNTKGVTVVIRVESPFWMKTEAYPLYIAFFFISIFLVYRYRTYHLRKSNKELKERENVTVQIELQKEQLALKNKNITDSISYAKRIQEALMPSEKSFKKILPESFVYHQPKDIVSGDFFWVSERGNKIYVAAVDCTGHGVPGAFMSIIGFELFRNITHSRGVDDPSQILNILNREFESVFKDVESFNFKHGMDIAFCVIDKESRILEFSGAVNPIYLIRDNKITEIRGSRFSVGLDDNYEDDVQTFENKQIILQEDDMIYLFSDGYADQFGGEEGKKFKYRRFRHLLLTIYQYTMEEQRRSLEERIKQWKGNLEQVDDILVIGFRPVFNK